MGTYVLTCEFDVSRRIGWSDEDLGTHIDAVFDRLHQAEGVLTAEANAHLDRGRTTVSLTVSMEDDDPRHSACVALAVAIRSTGGVHVGLLPLGEEAVVRPEKKLRSGLKMPTWNIRQTDWQPAP